WPGVISIQATLENGTWHMCAGALIDPQWVVTVAHCFFGAGDISRWEVVIGATDLSQPGPEAELRHIQTLQVHKYYDPTTARNNIALCPQQPQVWISWNILEYPGISWNILEYPFPAHPCSLCRTHPEQTPSCCRSGSPSPRAEPFHGNPAGNAALGGVGTGRAGLAAAPDPSLLAQGDSGGPLVCKDNVGDYFWLVGLTSWGRGCAGAKRPGVFTSIQPFHTWIQVQMGLLPPEA
ncbi:ACRO protein, partial [Leiothrix lutea]|nr:ACRO protein [Leiothrix lutea]